MFGTAAEVVPFRRPAIHADLTGPKFFEIVGGCHACGVEKILVLTDTPRPSFGALAFWGDAVNCHLGLIDGYRSVLPDLRAELIHQVNIRVKAQIARTMHHPICARLAKVAR